jgi:prefoldin subunit 5
MTTIAEISKQINQIGFSNTELSALIQNIQSIKASNAKLSLEVGGNCFVIQKTKRTPGVIVKVNKTRCVVEMKGGRYNVPMAMLEAA